MCGISVILQRSPAPDFLARLGAMHGAIQHRGPDGNGFLLVDGNGGALRSDTIEGLRGVGMSRLGVAFRRLKVCDLSDAANQPMGDRAGKCWVAFNGEIYNFRELRQELEAKGHIFRTLGDTEVVLEAYKAWGERCFERFEGMWAIVLVDLERNRLVLSRDRFGIKPLMWMITEDGALLLASEIKQIASTGQPLRSNRPLVEMFLRGHRYPFVEETFFSGVRSVPPASWCSIDLIAPQSPVFLPYWRLSDFTASGTAPVYAEAVDRTEELLARAVEAHRQADVKVGALLSGGVDSSTLVGLAHRQGLPKLPTYSFGYRDAAPRYCEMAFVDAMTKRDGIENHEISMDASWVVENTDRVLWALEEPPLGAPAFAQFRVFELCRREGTTVVLDGQGADEIAGGYQYHQRAFLKDRLRHGRLVAAVRELIAMGRRDHRSPAGLFADYFIAPLLRSPSSVPGIESGGVRANGEEFVMAQRDRGHDPSLTNQALYFDVKWGNAKIILGYGDRSAMAHSIEARVPYFDRAFVEFMFSLPDDYKVGYGDRKRALRDVARRYVPPVITERPDRMGFGTPDEEMLRGPLRGVVAEALNDPAFRMAGWVNAAAALRFCKIFMKGATKTIVAYGGCSC